MGDRSEGQKMRKIAPRRPSPSRDADALSPPAPAEAPTTPADMPPAPPRRLPTGLY